MAVSSSKKAEKVFHAVPSGLILAVFDGFLRNTGQIEIMQILCVCIKNMSRITYCAKNRKKSNKCLPIFQ